MAASDQEKTEAPTQKKRDEAKEEGKVPRSSELTTSAALIASAMLLNASVPMATTMRDLFADGLRASGSAALGMDSAIALLRSTSVRGGAVVAAWGGALILVSLAFAAPQARGVFTGKTLSPDFSRLSPLKNGKRMLGLQSWADLVKSLLKLALVSFAVYQALGAAWGDVMGLSQESTQSFFSVSRRYVVKLLMTSGLCYLALAALDYGWQWWQHEQSLRMSRDEVKQEMKQSDGDPMVKQRMRSIARSYARRQMMQAVPTADVVITNPTHIAVALVYDPLKASAPVVVAMGQRKVAQRIKEIAREHGVPCIENRPLARALLASSRIGQLIPAELYIAVAEILAFVIRRRLQHGQPFGERVA